MHKVLVIGAGAQGGPCTSILAGDDRVSEIRLGDINVGIAKRVADKISSEKIHVLTLDASDKWALVEAARDVDVILNFTLIKFNHLIMEAAVEAGAHYVDTACSGEFLDDWIERDEPRLHRAFLDIGKTALVGMGFAPGVANVLTRYTCDKMDRVNEIVIRVGRSVEGNCDEVVSAWKPTWSPEILLEDYADPPLVFQGGEFARVPIFSNPETYAFPEPIGELQLSSHMHEEVYLIPKFYVEKGLREVDFKYPVDKIVGAFIKMGFADDDSIDVGGVEVVPRDVLMRLVQRPGNQFLGETAESVLQSNLTGIMDINVVGEKNGERITYHISYRFTDGPNKERQRQLFDAYGTTLLHVALPAVVGAKMCLAGNVENGVVSPDRLNPQKFFEGMADRGVSFNFGESIQSHRIIQ
jgi:saccharopine dehydrogenase-like NADP-dependent oxidoreductase